MSRQKLIIMIFLIVMLHSGQSCIAAPVNTNYSTLDFPHDQAYINTIRPTFIGTLLDDQRNAVINETVQILIDGNIIGTALSNNNGIYHFYPEQAILDGHYNLTVYCLESQATFGPHYFTIDTTLPPITILYPQENQVILDNTFTASGITEENAMIETFLDNDTYGNVCYADASGNWSIEYTAANGIHTIIVQATDLAGNQGPLSQVRNFSVNV